jgi:hypothetical protein
MPMKKKERETTQKRADFCPVVFFCVDVQLQERKENEKE